jgi:hypothetical protein
VVWLTVPLNDAEALSPVSAGWLASPTVPAYLDTEGYLFAHRFMDLPDFRMHYVDEGRGHPILGRQSSPCLL